MAIHTYEQTIGGRVYQIQAARVRPNKWRAEIVRVPGMPTALMPFYGPTPDEAAQQLTQWLLRAHKNCSEAV